MRSIARHLAAALLAAVPCLGSWTGGVAAQSIQITSPIAYLYDLTERTPLFEKAADQPHPPASLVKMLTAETVFTALKAGQIALDTPLLVSVDTWRRGGAPSGAAAMFAPVNSRVTVHELLQGLIVSSANDAALALAEGIAGSEAAFVARMQERLTAIGIEGAVIRNATGFADAEQRITARAWTRLAEHLLVRHPEYYGYFSQKEFTFNQIRQLNRNPLIHAGMGADGLGTGNLGEGGFNLVASALQDDRRLILVLMGADSAQTRQQEARRLIEWGFRNFSRRPLLSRDTDLAVLNVTGGVERGVRVRLARDIETLLPRAREDKVTVEIAYRAPLVAPVALGQEVGTLRVTRGNVLALAVPVVAAESVAQGSLFKRATDNVWSVLKASFRGRSEPGKAPANSYAAAGRG